MNLTRDPTLIKTVLFDLDGTFADTAPDLAFALNQTLIAHGKPVLPFSSIRPMVSHGARALIALGFGITDADPRFIPLRQQLLDIYAQNIIRHTRLFDGMDALLTAIQQRGLRWGIVTNKPGWLTEPLLRGLERYNDASCIVSGDTLAQRKPDPAPLIHACSQTGSLVQECVYIGDAERDIIAGERAGMYTLVALFGYLDQQDQPHTWGADALVHTPAEIIHWIDAHNHSLASHG
ncbi:MAG: HAD-IA family hydrolase [Gammaproteobacteria bacterium]|nr:HAD-IA family hydrolase [Gammaproteobacteria bacterium]